MHEHSTPPVFQATDAKTSDVRRLNGVLLFPEQVKEIADEAITSDLEDRGVLVLLDYHDDPAIAHSRQMLNRARNLDG